MAVFYIIGLQVLLSIIALFPLEAFMLETCIPPPPVPEPINLWELPLPPAIADIAEPGDCSRDINPHGTGCMSASSTAFECGGFLPDGKHVLVLVTLVGAPLAPDPASIYNGTQIIAIKTDKTLFPNGDHWKCLTCGVSRLSEDFLYPQAFHDGRRALIGDNILECDSGELISLQCTPDTTHIYPLRWNTNADGSGDGAAIRELRLHPDNVHVGFSAFTIGSTLGQFSYFSRLQFNPSPSVGNPLTARYDLINITRLFNPDSPASVETSGSTLIINPKAIAVGELRGFSGDGSEVIYIGSPAESCNTDLFAADLNTGAVRRLTSHPEYVDPVSFSSDNKWVAIMDTRTTNRQMWVAAMRFIPPVTDLLSAGVTSSTRNNGERRFFRPFLLDRWGDRGTYFGQRINDQGSGVAGSGDFNDPNWNGRADPMWSPDSTQIVYWESHVVTPQCGGINPLPCFNSTEPGGRQNRAVLATLVSRVPTNPAPVASIPDIIPWGVPYVPGSSNPSHPGLDPGNYTLPGRISGHAAVQLGVNTETGLLNYVGVTYYNYTDNGFDILDGTESIYSETPSLTVVHLDWSSDLTQRSHSVNTKKTSSDGFHITMNIMENIFNATGTLTTTVDGVVYTQPENST